MNDILRHLIGAGFRFTMVQFQTLNSVYKKWLQHCAETLFLLQEHNQPNLP